MDEDYETYFPIAKCFPITIGPKDVMFQIPVMGYKVIKNEDMYPTADIFRHALRMSILKSPQ